MLKLHRLLLCILQVEKRRQFSEIWAQNPKKNTWIMYRLHQQMLVHQQIHPANHFKVRQHSPFSDNMLLNIVTLLENSIVSTFFIY